MAESPLMKKLRDRARAAGSRAAREILGQSGGRGAETVGAAVRGVQSGRRMIDEQSARMIESLGLATRADVERLSRRIGRVRKRLQRIIDELPERGVSESEPKQ
ncbi:MAG: hypothetical protein AAFV36_08900 [Myxococcota bacterium]